MITSFVHLSQFTLLQIIAAAIQWIAFHAMVHLQCIGHLQIIDHLQSTLFLGARAPSLEEKSTKIKKQPFKPVMRVWNSYIYNIQPLRDFQSISSMFCNLVLHRPISHGLHKHYKSTRIKSYKILIREDSHIYMYHNLTRCCSKSTLAVRL